MGTTVDFPVSLLRGHGSSGIASDVALVGASGVPRESGNRVNRDYKRGPAKKQYECREKAVPYFPASG
jgi:hypothetical protein